MATVWLSLTPQKEVTIHIFTVKIRMDVMDFVDKMDFRTVLRVKFTFHSGLAMIITSTERSHKIHQIFNKEVNS